MNPLTPYLAWIKAGLVLALLVGVYAWGSHNGAARVQAKFDAHLAADAKAEAKAVADARKAEQAKARELAEIAEKYEKDRADAQAAADRVIADLRSGAVRLRSHWQGCQATSRVSGDAAAAALADADARLREKDTGDLVGAGAGADAQIRGLQDVVRAYLGL